MFGLHKNELVRTSNYLRRVYARILPVLYVTCTKLALLSQMERVTIPVLDGQIALSKLITLGVQCYVGILLAKDVSAYTFQACNCTGTGLRTHSVFDPLLQDK